jgi:hypothetical protein
MLEQNYVHVQLTVVWLRNDNVKIYNIVKT